MFAFLLEASWQVLLAVFVTMGALTLGTTLQSYIANDVATMEDRLWIWQRYGTAFRALYTMYEVTFAGNWNLN